MQCQWGRVRRRRRGPQNAVGDSDAPGSPRPRSRGRCWLGRRSGGIRAARRLERASAVRVVTFSFLCPLLEKYGTFIARCNALIEKVSSFRDSLPVDGDLLDLCGASWGLRAAAGPGARNCSERMNATVPGDVYSDLHAAGKIGDPLGAFGDWETAWAGRTSWTYR
eukprot:SAG31_NODE_948_length_10825_cov_9.412829_19_plen_166_part_00